MKIFLRFAFVLIVLFGLLLGVAAVLDSKSRQRELEEVFDNAVVTEKYNVDVIHCLTLEDSIGGITVRRVRDELFEFVEIGDTLVKRAGDANCKVLNSPLHKHHVFELHTHK